MRNGAICKERRREGTVSRCLLSCKRDLLPICEERATEMFNEINSLKEKILEWHHDLMIARAPSFIDACMIDNIIADMREVL